MRFGLLDLLFPIVCGFIGIIFGPMLTSGLPTSIRTFAGPLGGLCFYLVIVYPVYGGLKLFPLVLPRCPCCEKFQDGFHISGNYPRIIFRCPTCENEFVVWHNGKVGIDETWNNPVLVLKWPYAFGVYRRAKRPGN